MSNYSALKSLFQSGEISPYYGGRTDSDVYASGVAEMRNAIPHSLGGFRKRPGTRYVASPLDSTYLRPIELYTDEKCWIVWITAGHFYLFDAMNDNPESVASTTNTYTAAEINEIKYRANKGILYLVHQNHKPATLSINRLGDTYTLTFADMTFVTDASDPERCVDFSTAGNYPSAITFKGGRLFFGATANKPTTTFASRTPSGGQDRYNDFTLYDNQEGFEPTTDQTVIQGKKYYAFSGGQYNEVTNPTGNPAAQGYYEWTVKPEITSSHAFELQENDMYGTKIFWYVVQNRLIVGNARSVLMDNGAASTPDGFDLVVTLNTGAADIQAKVFKNYACYAGASGKSLHLMVWDEDAKGYTTIEVSKGSSHLFRNGIADFDIMLDPEPIIWVLTADGELLSCLVDTSAGTTGWTKHERKNGKYEALCITGISHSRLFLEIVDAGVHHFETLELMKDDYIDSALYADCCTEFDLGYSLSTDSEVNRSKKYYILTDGKYIEVEYEGTEDPQALGWYEKNFTRKVEVNPALKGYPVIGFCDNGIMPSKIAEEDPDDHKVYVTYVMDVNKGYIGFPIETKVHLFSPEIPANGTSQGKLKRINKLTLRVYESFGGEVGTELSNTTLLLTRRYGVYKYGTPISLISEDLEAEISSKNTKDGSVYIVHTDPTPFNLLSMVTNYELVEA